jgi:polyisoprenoid-binding protein YceI
MINTTARRISSIALLSAAAILAPQVLGAAADQAAAAPALTVCTVDDTHSLALFRIQHMGAGQFWGRFNDVSGNFTFEPGKAEGMKFDITIKTESVDTGVEGLNKHLRSPDFFGAKDFPTMTFKSTAFKKTADNTYDVTGDLTFKGQTKPITVSLTHIGTGPGRRGGEVAGVETTFTIKRSEWNINFLPGALGEDVTLTVALEGGRK